MPKAKRKKRITRDIPAADQAATAAPEAAPEEAKPSRERRRRVPFGGHRRRLEVASKDPNYKYYWQKNTADFIPRMLDAGYEFVSKRQAERWTPEELVNQEHRGGNESIVDRVERYGGKDEHGDEYNLILMRQPMAYALEDEAEREKRNMETDEAIFRQQFPGDTGDSSGRYGDINVTVKHEE